MKSMAVRPLISLIDINSQLKPLPDRKAWAEIRRDYGQPEAPGAQKNRGRSLALFPLFSCVFSVDFPYYYDIMDRSDH